MVKPLNPHYSLENPASIFDEEAMTALQLAGRTADKVNECVEQVNGIPQKVADSYRENLENGFFDRQIEEYTEKVTREINQHQADMENLVRESATAMTEQVNENYATMEAEFAAAEGSMGARVEALDARVNSALSTISGASPVQDAEVTDARIGQDGKTYDTLGESVRTQMGNVAPVMILFTNLFRINRQTRKITLRVTSSGKMTVKIASTSVRVGVSTYTPNTTEWDIPPITGKPLHMVMHKADSDKNVTLEIINNDDYFPAAGDTILFTMYSTYVYPVAISPTNIEVDGYNLMPMPDGLKKYTRQFIPVNTNLAIDFVNMTATIRSGHYALPNYAKGAHAIKNDITVTFPYDGFLKFLVFHHGTETMTVEDRYYEAKDDDFILGTITGYKFVPVEIPSECVVFNTSKGELGNEYWHMADFFRPLASPGNNFKIVLGGDSITMGAGTTGSNGTGGVIFNDGTKDWLRQGSTSRCWANLFKEYIENNYDATVTNNGCSGTHANWWDEHKADLIPSDTDLFILTLGTNDRKVQDDEKTDAENKAMFYNHLSNIVDYCHRIKVPILLCTPVPTTSENESDGALKLSHCFEMAQVVKRVCADYKMDCADLYNEVFYYFLDKGLEYAPYLPDGLHPGDELHKIMFYRYLKLFGLSPSHILL